MFQADKSAESLVPKSVSLSAPTDLQTCLPMTMLHHTVLLLGLILMINLVKTEILKVLRMSIRILTVPKVRKALLMLNKLNTHYNTRHFDGPTFIT